MAERLIFNPETGELIYTSRHGSLSDVIKQDEPPAPIKAEIQEESDKHKLSDKIRAARMAKRLRQSLDNSDMEVRRSALEILLSSAVGYRELVPHLIFALKDPIPEIRKLSLKSLLRCRPTASQFKEFIPLLKDKQEGIRSVALDAVKAFGERANILAGTILGLLEMGHSVDDIATCIQRTGVTPPSIAQVSSLIRSSNAETRLKSISVFAKADHKSLPVLHLIVPRLDDPRVEIQKKAREAFSQLGFHFSAINEIRRQLTHTNPDRRLAIIELLSGCGPSAIELSSDLVDLISDERSEEITDAAEHAIDSIGLTKDALKTLLRLSKHPRWQYRKKSLELISKHPDVMEQSAPIIIPLMADKEFVVRRTARRLFPMLGIGAESESYLKPLLTSTDHGLKTKLIRLLKESETDAEGLSHLIIARIEESSFDIAKEAANALKKTGLNGEAWRIAERILRNSKQDRKLLLLDVFTSLGAKARKGAQMICSRMGDTDQIIRDAATEAFVSIGFDSSCLPIVKQLIQHQNREFRLTIIEALGKCGFTAGAASEFLNNRLEDKDAEVGRAAKAALKAIQNN